MPALSISDATQVLARGVEEAKLSDLGEIYAELFPENSSPTEPTAGEIARHVRKGLEAEELVDLWNVVFPADRNVWYDEEEHAIHYNEELVGHSD